MARLVVKRTPWWVSQKKLLFVWLPLASLQAATLAGFGYFYHRIDNLEEQTNETNKQTAAFNGDSLPLHTITTPEAVVAPVPPIPAAPERDVPDLHSTLLASVNPATAPNIAPQTPPKIEVTYYQVKPTPASPEPVAKPTPPAPKPVVAEKTVEKKSVPAPEPMVKDKPKPEVKKVVPVPEPTPPAAKVKAKEAARTAQANREGLHVLIKTEPKAADPLPSQVDSVWVYLGELRNYGWYDQKLHISPSSGLPEIGQVYQTQFIPNVYSSPYGRQLAGGFHLGESVLIHDVRRGRNDDVWALVSAQ